LDTATSAERHAIETVLQERSYDKVPFGSVLAIVKKYDGIQRTRERAAQFTDRARQIVAEFPNNPYQRALFTLTDLVTERDR